MYNAIIVDDEQFELDMLSRMAVWKNNNINILKTFTDVNEALEYVKYNEVDIIVSDMVMPKTSGLEFLSMIRKLYGMKMVFVFVSAYSDFTYTREAIINNVFDYMLKPINMIELNSLCKRINEYLQDRDREKELNLNAMECQQAIVDCINKNITTSEMEQIFLNNKVYLSASKTKMCLVGIEIDEFEALLQKWKYSVDRLYYAIENIINNNDDNNKKFIFIPLKYSESKILYICIIADKQEIQDVQSMIEKMFFDCESVMKHHIDIKVMSAIVPFDNLYDEIKNNIGLGETDIANRELIDKAIKYIEEHYLEDISLMQIAEYLSISMYHTSRLFKKYMGETFMNYICSFRLGKAKQLLVTTNMTIAKIAIQTGFSTERKFYRIFQRSMDCTPSEYRNKFFK